MGPGQMMQNSLQQVSPNTMMTYNLSQTIHSPTIPKVSPNQNKKGKSVQANPKRASQKPVNLKPVELDDSDEEPLYASNDEESEDDDDDDDVIDYVSLKSAESSKKISSQKKTMIQSNKVDSSGLKATPPHHSEEADPNVKISSPGKNERKTL